MPAGGAAGTLLAKSSATDYATQWVSTIGASQITAGAVSQVIAAVNLTTDIWSNVALGAGYSTVPGAAVVGTVPDATDALFFNVNAELQMASPPTQTWAGWTLFVDGGLYRYGPLIFCPPSQTTMVPWSGTLLAAATSSLVTPLSAGTHTFDVRLYCYASVASGGYLRASSFYPMERFAFEVWVIRR